jgi:hypothetical protein
MLKQLDTLIGFAVVMSVVSLLITIITQMVSSLLGLRGKNLADALEAMILKLDPDINKQVADMGKKLADQVLTHPVISDSTLSMKGSWPLRWKRASSVRADELLEIIRDMAGTSAAPAAAPATPEQAAAKLLATLNAPSIATTAAIGALTAKLPDLALQQGNAVIAQFNAATDVALGNLQQWFNSAQDRATQWFAMHTRIVTVVAAILLAFVLQLDTFRLIQRLSSDPAARAKLVAAAGAVEKQGQAVLSNASATNLTTLTNVLSELPSQSLSQVSQSGIEFVPDPYPSIYSGQWSWPGPHLLGILASAALLSLGAPFWFNLLKSLTNLRPMLAQQIEKNPTSAGSTQT